ncbi:serine/threonine-protein kinase [Streptomyces sp. NPDC091376]|uniref:serine/threonine-protein kinase n=1 Tax=Streptomyces sp. NPDC091376 TaxID=3365994 RepID=UPI00382C939D
MEALDARDPRTVGEYRILGRLGEGGMGRVYVARNAGGRSVALKFVHADMAALPGFRERFRREVEVVRRVAGAGTVPLVDAGADERHPWYASEYVPGPSLQEAVDTFGPLPADALWRFAADLAATLEHVHGHELVHRDLKPSNVLLSTAGPRLIDFGIVRAALDTVLTLNGERLGTPAYMSPEQAYGEQVTAASDIYSYGLTVAFAATGRVPLRGTLAGPLPGVDPALDELVRHCLDPDPGRRPAAADLVARARALDTTTDTWLPAPVASLIARTSEELLNLDTQATPDRPDTPPRLPAEAPAGSSSPAPAAAAGFHEAATRLSAPPPLPRTRVYENPYPNVAPGAPSSPSTPPGPGSARALSAPGTPPGPGTPPVKAQTWPPRGAVAAGPPSAPEPAAGDWPYRGFLGRPRIGLMWLAPLAACSFLLAFALPSAMGGLRLLAAAALMSLCFWLAADRNRTDRVRWFRLNQTYWLTLGLLTLQGWSAVAAYDKDLLEAVGRRSDISGLQIVVGGLLNALELFLALGSLALLYVVPAAIGRWIRARRSGL